MSHPEFDARQRMSDFDIELKLLLEAIYPKYQHDFRHYAMSSPRRRLSQALDEFGLGTLSQLQDRIMRDSEQFSRLFQYLTVQVSDMFRDPAYFSRCVNMCCRVFARIRRSRCGSPAAARAKSYGR